VEDRSSLTKGLPDVWHRAEEWYGFAVNPRSKPGFHIIATVDEKTYTPGRTTMGADHPLVWQIDTPCIPRLVTAPRCIRNHS
jgi:hypothetical protein